MVAFGEELEAAKSAMPQHRLHYLDYTGLARMLEEAVKGEALGVLLQQNATMTLASKPLADSAGSTLSTRFFSQLEREISKVNDFVVAKVTTLKSSLEMVLEQSRSPNVNSKALRDEAARLERELVGLNQFIRANLIGFRKVKLHPRRLRARAP